MIPKCQNGIVSSFLRFFFSIELHLLIPRAIIEPIKREKHIEKNRRKLGRKCSVFHGPTVMSISTRCLTIFAYFYDIKRALFYFILQQRAFRNRLLTGPIQQPLKPRIVLQTFYKRTCWFRILDAGFYSYGLFCK